MNRPFNDHHGEVTRRGLSLAVTIYHQRKSGVFKLKKVQVADLFHTRISVLLQKQSTFSYIPYLEDCCRSLQDQEEYPHDLYMTALVQLQHISEKIDRLSENHRQELMRPGSGLELYVTSVRSDLDAFQNRQTFNINDARESDRRTIAIYSC
jgi:hypothetical protein